MRQIKLLDPCYSVIDRFDLMTLLPDLRVIIEPNPQSGATNMAVDEMMLERAIADNIATLRWYEWKEPTVSLGYFQNESELESDPLLMNLPAVRRLTGGGAIVHDGDLTYSIALPASQKLFAKPEELYDLIHNSVAATLQSIQVPARLRGQTVKKAHEPLLCFQRQDSHDIVLKGFKILGSAQRRRRGAILQHGSLIRCRSPFAPHIPGIAELCTTETPLNLTSLLSHSVAKSIAASSSFYASFTAEVEIASPCVKDSMADTNDRGHVEFGDRFTR